jgi:hypothetical protein
MAKTPESQLRAIRKYDTEKRTDVAVTYRLSPEQIADLDAVRGEKSRGAFLKAAGLKAIEAALKRVR